MLSIDSRYNSDYLTIPNRRAHQQLFFLTELFHTLPHVHGKPKHAARRSVVFVEQPNWVAFNQEFKPRSLIFTTFEFDVPTTFSLRRNRFVMVSYPSAKHF